MNEELLKAIDYALNGQWDLAHGIVQGHEEDSTAAWIHAVLHKMEGDLANSRYWYHRAEKMEHIDDESRSELEMIRMAIRGS